MSEFTVLAAIEIGMNVVFAMESFLFAIALYNIPLFHINLKSIITFLFIMMTIAAILRIAVLTYGLLEDDGAFCYNENRIWSSPIKFLDYACYVARINTFMTIGSIIFERLLACAMLDKYEKYRDWRIIGVLLTVAASTSAFTAYLIIYVRIPVLIFVVLAESANLCGICIFITIYKWNNTRYKKALWNPSYSLSYRYQVSENMRTAKIMELLIGYEFVVNSIAFFLYYSGYLANDNDFKQLSKLFFDYLIAFYGMSIPLVAICVIPMYRQHFIAKWHAAKSRVSPGRPTPHKLSHLRNDHGKRIVVDSKSEAKVYFDQLKSSWN